MRRSVDRIRYSGEIGSIHAQVQRPRARKIGAVENHPEHVQEKEQKTMDAEIEENLLLGLMHHPELHHNQHDHDYDGAEDIYSHVKSHYRPK